MIPAKFTVYFIALNNDEYAVTIYHMFENNALKEAGEAFGPSLTKVVGYDLNGMPKVLWETKEPR